jgi:hypothetical protein
MKTILRSKINLIWKVYNSYQYLYNQNNLQPPQSHETVPLIKLELLIFYLDIIAWIETLEAGAISCCGFITESSAKSNYGYIFREIPILV